MNGERGNGKAVNGEQGTGNGRTRWQGILTGACLAAAMACAQQTPLVSVRVDQTAAGHHLTLVPAKGARINARVRPALEQSDGRVLYFDAPQLPADSGYYTIEPYLDLSDPDPPRGLVRVGVCPAGERVCRVVVLTL